MRLHLLVTLMVLPATLQAQGPTPLRRCVALADSAPPATALAACGVALAYYDSIGSTPLRTRIHFA